MKHQDLAITSLGIAIILALMALLSGCWGRDDAPAAPPAPAAPSATAPAPRPDAKPDATPTEQLDRRIADLTGQLAQAQADRQAEQQRATEAEQAAWRRWARWICALGLPLATAAAGLGLWFGLGRIAVPVAGAAILACLTLLGFAESLRWAAWLAPVLGLGALCAVAWILVRRRDAALAATARLGDRFEAGAAELQDKLAAQQAQLAAGVHRLVQRARGKP